MAFRKKSRTRKSSCVTVRDLTSRGVARFPLLSGERVERRKGYPYPDWEGGVHLSWSMREGTPILTRGSPWKGAGTSDGVTHPPEGTWDQWLGYPERRPGTSDWDTHSPEGTLHQWLGYHQKGFGTSDWYTHLPERTWEQWLGYPLPQKGCGTSDWGTPSPVNRQTLVKNITSGRTSYTDGNEFNYVTTTSQSYYSSLYGAVSWYWYAPVHS